MTSPGQAPEQTVQTVSAPALAPYGLIIDHVRIMPAGKRRVVQVTVDRDLSDLPEGDETSPVAPLDLDEVADAARAIDVALDARADDLFGGHPYVLEVSSAGAERVLSLPRHYRANVGRLVALRLADGGTLRARLVAAGADAVTVRKPADKGGTGGKGGKGARRAEAGDVTTVDAERARDRVLAYPEIARAQVQVEFGRGDTLDALSEDENADTLNDAGGDLGQEDR